MDKKQVKLDVTFEEALRRIANTPKEVVENVVTAKKEVYNAEKATKKSPSGSRKTA